MKRQKNGNEQASRRSLLHAHTMCICTDTHTHMHTQCSMPNSMWFRRMPFGIYAVPIRVSFSPHSHPHAFPFWHFGDAGNEDDDEDDDKPKLAMEICGACFDFHPMDLCIVSLNTNIRREVCVACKAYIYHFPHHEECEKPHRMISTVIYVKFAQHFT